MKFARFWRREFFGNDYDNCSALDEATNAPQNRRRLGLCASRGLLSVIAIVKALFMVAWLSKEHLLLEYDCRTADWLNARALDQHDVTQNLAEPIVLKRKNGVATVWFTDEDFTPREPSIYPVDDGETVDANDRSGRRRRRSVDESTRSSQEVLSEDIPLKPGKRRRIIKIVRRPVTVEHGSDNLDGSFRRHWREVSPKADENSAVTSNNEFKSGFGAPGKLLKRVKIIKRRRKPKKIAENGTAASVRPAEEKISRKASDAEGRRRSIQAKSLEKIENSAENSIENEAAISTTSRPPLIADKSTRKSPTNVLLNSTTIGAPPQLLQSKITTDDEQNSSAAKLASHFLAQFRVFKRDALCVARTLLDAWCGVQLAALLLFLAGVAGYRRAPAAVKYLLMPHLILDTLLLLTLFVFVLTTIVFGALLFAFVAEMTLGQIGVWLAFAGLLTSVLVVYGVTFTVMLCCFETIIHDLRRSAIKNGATICGCPNCRRPARFVRQRRSIQPASVADRPSR